MGFNNGSKATVKESKTGKRKTVASINNKKDIKKLQKKYATTVRERNFIALDTENESDVGGIDSFTCGHLYGQLKSKKTGNKLIIDHHYRDVWKFQEDLLYYTAKPNTIAVGFNIDYDLYSFMDIVNESKSLRTDSKVIVMGLTNNKGKIWDLTNIVDRDLEHWINRLKDKPKYQKYQLEKTSFDDGDIDRHNRLDTIGTWALADFLQDYFKSVWNVPLGVTIGNTALNIFKTHYLKYTIERERNPIIDNFERASYHGGRNEIFYRGWQNVDSYDVNSMYVYIMMHHYFPMPDSVRYVPNPDSLFTDWRYYYTHYLGVYDVLIEVPEMFICPLPVTYKVCGTAKIVYPYGFIRGVYTNVELQMAEKYGCKIHKCYSFLYYTKKDKLFSEFANDVWNKRINFRNKCMRKIDNTCQKCDYSDNEKSCSRFVVNPNYDKAMDDMTKKAGNSCYGKMSQQTRKYSYYGKERYIPKDLLKLINQDIKKPLNERNFSINHYTYQDEPYVFIASDERVDSKHSFTILSSFVASYARIKWYEAAKPIEQYVKYGDTDSLKVEHGIQVPFNTGNELGDFSFEYNKYQPFYAPKNYGTDDDRKMKSIPKRAIKTVDDDASGVMKFEFKRPRKFKTSIRDDKPISQWFMDEKEVDMYDDKRLWHGKKFYAHGVNSRALYMNIDGVIEELEIASK